MCEKCSTFTSVMGATGYTEKIMGKCRPAVPVRPFLMSDWTHTASPLFRQALVKPMNTGVVVTLLRRG